MKFVYSLVEESLGWQWLLFANRSIMEQAALNDLPVRQNEDAYLNMQASAKTLYRRAQRWFYLQGMLTVAVPLVFALILLLAPQVWPQAAALASSLKAWFALYGLIVIFADDQLLDDIQQDLKKRAAIAQEMFDTDLFCLRWRKGKVGQRLTVAETDALARKWRRVDPNFVKVKDWYPPVLGGLPIHVARVICQRLNIWWDSGMRRKYATLLSGFAALLLLTVIVACLVLDLSVADALLACITVAPALRWALRERKRQRSTADLLDRQHASAKELSDRVIYGLISEEEATLESRELQDEIYDRRKTSPTGFGWIYSFFRNENESAMMVDASHCVAAYLRALRSVNTTNSGA